jgi:hypothetical protein
VALARQARAPQSFRAQRLRGSLARRGRAAIGPAAAARAEQRAVAESDAQIDETLRMTMSVSKEQKREQGVSR